MAKKIEVITFRTDSETKTQIEKMAESKEWSVAQVVDKICKEYFSKQKEKTNEKTINNSIEIHNNTGNINYTSNQSN